MLIFIHFILLFGIIIYANVVAVRLAESLKNCIEIIKDSDILFYDSIEKDPAGRGRMSLVKNWSQNNNDIHEAQLFLHYYNIYIKTIIFFFLFGLCGAPIYWFWS
jgi:hypothetical protein